MGHHLIGGGPFYMNRNTLNKQLILDRIVVDPVTGCWNWQCDKDDKGYGRVRTGNRNQLKAHRVAWSLWNGEIPSGINCCHKCDNPSCVNPDHLFLGTDLENNHDMISKGRNVVLKGERHGMHKLTAEQVVEIRASTGTLMTVASRYGVSFSTIALIKTRKTWKHI